MREVVRAWISRPRTISSLRMSFDAVAMTVNLRLANCFACVEFELLNVPGLVFLTLSRAETQ